MSVRRVTAAVIGALSLVAPVTAAAAGNAGFVVSQSQFNQMFPQHGSFYSYKGLTVALSAYPGFAGTGDEAAKKREARRSWPTSATRTGGLKYVVEQNTANYPHYCDRSQSYGCRPAGAPYYGRGPLQLSWNYNYKAAGDALHIDLLHDPSRVRRTPPCPGRPACGSGTRRRAPAP